MNPCSRKSERSFRRGVHAWLSYWSSSRSSASSSRCCLPAIQAAREAGRRAQCKNHLRQIAVACLNFESTHKAFPAGGWGFLWMGDPDRGVGRGQPGGWIFQVTSYLGRGASYSQVGKGLYGRSERESNSRSRWAR